MPGLSGCAMPGGEEDLFRPVTDSLASTAANMMILSMPLGDPRYKQYFAIAYFLSTLYAH